MKTAERDSGIVEVPSHHSVEETIGRIEALLHDRGVTLFAVIDHSGEAAKAGLAMPPTRLLIFGSPKAGTPLMLASPASAIDLPLKILVREAPGGGVILAYDDPAYLMRRHGLPPESLPVLAAVASVARAAAE